MKLRLGYPDRIVEVDGKRVLVFKGRLFSVPLDEVVIHHRWGNGLLPPAVREVAEDIVYALLRTGKLEDGMVPAEMSGQGAVS